MHAAQHTRLRGLSAGVLGKELIDKFGFFTCSGTTNDVSEGFLVPGGFMFIWGLGRAGKSGVFVFRGQGQGHMHILRL